jgi:hypothetical protein
MTGQGGSKWCPSCGSAVELEDSFCRSCGRALGASPSATAPRHEQDEADVPEAVASHQIAADQGSGRSRRNRWLVAGAIVILVVAIAAVAVVTLSKSQISPEASAAAKQRRAEIAQRQAFVALKARLYGPFTAAMGQRTKFFIAEASFLDATRDANTKVKKYQAESQKVEAEDKQIQNANSGLESACREPYSSVPCPNPTYPEAPSAPAVKEDVANLHRAVTDLSSLNAEVLAGTPQPELRTFYAQMQAAITALTTDAQANANILSEGVTEPTNGSHGYLEEKKLATIHPENGLPSVKLMNHQAVALIRMLHLDITQYDVPGGTDVNPTDHSVAQ